jgi:hypothetical protein
MLIERSWGWVDLVLQLVIGDPLELGRFPSQIRLCESSTLHFPQAVHYLPAGH